MKKITFASVFLSLIVIMSCNNKTANQNSGSWIFHSITYQGQYATFGREFALVNYTGDRLPTGSVSLTFSDSGLSSATLTARYNDSLHHLNPPVLNHDTVITRPNRHPAGNGPTHTSYIPTNVFPPDSGYVYIQVTDSSQYVSWKISGSSTPAVTVSIVGGKYHVTIPPIMLVDTNWTPQYLPSIIGKPTGTDSSLFSGTIIQTQ